METVSFPTFEMYYGVGGTHVRILDEWYGYLKNMVEWFK
jgi:hypothetical protein